MVKQLFRYENYSSVMYIALIFVSLLLIFNFANIADNILDNGNSLTGLAIKNTTDTSPYILYWILLIGVIVAILIVTIVLSSFILQRLR